MGHRREPNGVANTCRRNCPLVNILQAAAHHENRGHGHEMVSSYLKIYLFVTFLIIIEYLKLNVIIYELVLILNPYT